MTDNDAFKLLGIDRIVFRRMQKKENFPGECQRLVYDFYMQKVSELVQARDKLLENEPKI